MLAIEIWSEGDKVQFRENASQTLQEFLEYRQTKINKDYPNNDYAFLIANQTFGITVGLATIANMCSISHSGALIAYTHASLKQLAATLGKFINNRNHCYLVLYMVLNFSSRNGSFLWYAAR